MFKCGISSPCDTPSWKHLIQWKLKFVVQSTRYNSDGHQRRKNRVQFSLIYFFIVLETLVHNPDLPNKHSLFCGRRSTWEVITASPDFGDNANPPNASITDTGPLFRLVGGAETSSVAYVLVMDVSASMQESVVASWPKFRPHNSKIGLIKISVLRKIR